MHTTVDMGLGLGYYQTVRILDIHCTLFITG